MDATGSVIAKIKTHEQGLYAAERKVAHFILSDPSRAIDANVSETAEISGVSEATVVRFCKRLGYSGFYQMKLQLSHDIGKQSTAGLRQTAPSSMQDRLLQISSRVEAIAQRLNPSVVKLCAAAINNCGVVHVVGCGQSRILASDVVFRLSGYGIRATGGWDVRTDIANLLLAPKEDIAVCISKSGETKKTNSALEIALQRGMTTIAITAAEKNPLAASATFSLCAGIHPQDERDSNIYLMAVLDSIFSYVQSKLPDSDYLETIISESRL